MRHIEAGYQTALVAWYRRAYPEISDLLAGYLAGVNVGSRTGLRMKQMGLVRGWPDLHLSVPNKKHHGMYIEMKTQTGKLTKEQKDIHQQLSDQGYLVVTSYGWDIAKDEIVKYLNER